MITPAAGTRDGAGSDAGGHQRRPRGVSRAGVVGPAQLEAARIAPLAAARRRPALTFPHLYQVPAFIRKSILPLVR